MGKGIISHLPFQESPKVLDVNVMTFLGIEKKLGYMEDGL